MHALSTLWHGWKVFCWLKDMNKAIINDFIYILRLHTATPFRCCHSGSSAFSSPYRLHPSLPHELSAGPPSLHQWSFSFPPFWQLHNPDTESPNSHFQTFPSLLLPPSFLFLCPCTAVSTSTLLVNSTIGSRSFLTIHIFDLKILHRIPFLTYLSMVGNSTRSTLACGPPVAGYLFTF